MNSQNLKFIASNITNRVKAIEDKPIVITSVVGGVAMFSACAISGGGTILGTIVAITYGIILGIYIGFMLYFALNLLKSLIFQTEFTMFN